MGIDKPHDFKDAYKLWLKAAKGNQQRAQWALGDLYFQDEKSVYPTIYTEVAKRNGV
jgi:TPR repeat protein